MRQTEIRITGEDNANLVAGEGGVDLEPVMEGGRQVAMRIVGVREGTTAARLGAKNGDLVESFNGIPLVSISEAYRAGGIASRSQRIVIRGTRDGEPYETILVLDEA